MERFGSMYKAVGMPDSEGEPEGSGNEKLLEESRARFENPKRFLDDIEEIEQISRPMTPEERKMHQHADRISDQIMEKYGSERLSIPEKNTFIVKRGQWPDDLQQDAGGSYNPDAQLMAIEESPVRIEAAKRFLHEQIHFKSYNAIQGVEVEAPQEDKVYLFVGDYRVGLTMRSRDGKETYFLNLNEAVTEELVKRHVDELLDDEMFDAEKQDFETMKRANERMKEQGEEDQFSAEIEDPDTIYANLFEPESKMTDQLVPDRKEGDWVAYSVKISYSAQRAVLQELTEKIHERNSDKYPDSDAVFDEFARAALSGRLLPLAKLVDETFGSGTFRKIGESDPDIEKLKQVVDDLK